MSIFTIILGICCLIIIFGTFLACALTVVYGIAEEIARTVHQHRAKLGEQRKALQTNIAGLEHQLGMDDE